MAGNRYHTRKDFACEKKCANGLSRYISIITAVFIFRKIETKRIDNEEEYKYSMNMTSTEKIEIQQMINEAVRAGIREALQAIFQDRDTVMELIEDTAFVEAIKGERTEKSTPESEIFSILDSFK